MLQLKARVNGQLDSQESAQANCTGQYWQCRRD